MKLKNTLRSEKRKAQEVRVSPSPPGHYICDICEKKRAKFGVFLCGECDLDLQRKIDKLISMAVNGGKLRCQLMKKNKKMARIQVMD